MPIFEFILHVYAFFSGSIEYPENVQLHDHTNIVENNYMDESMTNISSNHRTYTIPDYDKINKTEQLSPYGSSNSCAYCRRNLKYVYKETYAYDGREFCSTGCRKKFSDNDLVALGQGYTLDEREETPIFRAVFHEQVLQQI